MDVGQVLADRFLLERIAGSGAMGTVFRAVDQRSDSLAAVKVVKPRDDQKLIERFTREARLLAELRHPNIVRYLDHGRTAAGELYLAMEWLEGEDLAARLAAADPKLEDTVRIVTQAAAALAAAHTRHIIHRDVKPSNLFLVDFSVARVKLLDFGIARAEGSGLTETGVLVGTPSYMAPEQVRGARDLDARVDVFALGAVLFRCVAGRPPFHGSSIEDVYRRILHEDPPHLREHAPDAPEALADLCARMLAKDPAARPADAGALLAELLALDEASARGRAAGRRELTGVERRLGCVVVAHLAGATRSEEELAPTLLAEGSEPSASALRPDPAAAARAVATAHGARLERADRDLIALSLTGPQVATDQARHAARMALALRDALPGARVALMTGRSAGRLSVSDQDLPGAPRGAPRLDAVTAGLLEARFELAGDEHGLYLLGERSEDDEPRPLLGRRTPFVGRERELSLLEGIFASCVEEGARAALVMAPAGTGKSRLRKELAVRLRRRGDGVEVWTAAGDPMRAGAPFGLLAESIRAACGIRGPEPLADKQAALRARVASRLAPERAQPVAEFLGELAAVPLGDDSPALRGARRDPVLLGEQMRGAWLEWLAAETTGQPVVIVFEDLHWGDLPTVKFVDAALRELSERPLMVLGLARPEVRDLFPRLWADRGLQELHLGTLSRRAAERLAGEVLGGAVDAATLGAVVERAGGNAFYLEELIRQVAGGGAASLPESVLAMAESRLEALGAEGRRVLRAASVFGEVFWAGGVGALLATDVGALLEDLAERELIQRRERARFTGEIEYAFRHGLLREAAYAMLTDADRALGHRLAARWLVGAGESEAMVLAEHHARGGEPEAAIGWMRRAAEQALEGGDFEAALTRATRALALGAQGEERTALLLDELEALKWLGRLSAAVAKARAIMDETKPGSPAWLQALGNRSVDRGQIDALEQAVAAVPFPPADPALYLVVVGRVLSQSFIVRHERRVAPLYRQWQELADATDLSDPALAAWVHQTRAFHAAALGAIDKVLTRCRAAQAAFAAAGDQRNALTGCVDEVWSLLALGLNAEALALSSELFETAQHKGLARLVPHAQCLRTVSLGRVGRLEEALALAGECADRLKESGHRNHTFARTVQASLLHELGRLHEAEQVALQAIAEAGGDLSEFSPLGTLGLVLLAQGRLDEAAAAVVPPPMGVTTLSDGEGGPPRHLRARAEICWARGDREGARAALAVASEVLRRAEAAISDPALRESMARNVPDYARIHELERAWGAPE